MNVNQVATMCKKEMTEVLKEIEFGFQLFFIVTIC